GKVDGIGHLLIIAALFVVFADPGREHPCCRPALAPLVSGTSLLAAIFLYSGTHALYYGPWRPALVPLATGAALLAIMGLYLHGVAHRLVASMTCRFRRWFIDTRWDAGGEDGQTPAVQAGYGAFQ